MSLPSALSVATMIVNLLVTGLTIAVARGLGSRHVWWFGSAALWAAVFGAANIPIGLDVSALTSERASRISLFATGMHGASWIGYTVAFEGRRAFPIERLGFGITAFLAVLGLVPGALVAPGQVTRTVAYGLVYRDAVPTTMGALACVYFCVALTALAVRQGLLVARGRRRAWPVFIGLASLSVAAVIDSFAYAGNTNLPYVVELALLLLVTCVGVSLSTQFVDNTRALALSTKQLAEAQAELVARERLAAVGEMSAIVAHEVRNPLAVMFNAIAGLRRELPSEARETGAGHAPELLTILEEEAQQLRRLVDDFLDFSRPVSLRIRAADVGGLVEAAVDAARAAAPSPHRVAIRLAPNLGTIQCDERLVRHAIANLVANALQLEGQAIDIDVRASIDAGTLRIAIVDRGPGVAAELVARLFDPFFTTRARGTGLGLPVVRRIADAHQGTVRYEPTSGGGATFVLELPRAGHRAEMLPAAAE
jgi:signal transduction histidine kinase